MKIREYKSYDEYLQHQAEKTKDASRIKKWKDRYQSRTNCFLKRFKALELGQGLKILCLGARLGCEVDAFNQLGNEAIGIDIVPFKPFVIEGDFHNLNFKEKTFDVVYSNSFDHSCNPEKFISEANRVLKDGGLFLLDIFLDLFSEYEVLEIKSENEIVEMVKSINFNFVFSNNTVAKLYKNKNQEKHLLFRKKVV